MNLFSTIEQLLAEGQNPDDCGDQLWAKFGRQYAVLIMDSSGFTRTTQSYGVLCFLSRLVQVRQVALPVLERCQALSMRFEADNIYACFDTPQQAVEAAIAIRQGIADRGVIFPNGDPFKVCSGIGYGKLLYSETLEGCFGDEVNLASKLGEDVAEPDEVLLTQACYEALPDTLQHGFQRLNVDVSKTHITYYLQVA